MKNPAHIHLRDCGLMLVFVLAAACSGGGGGGSSSGGGTSTPQLSGTVLFSSDSSQVPGTPPPAAGSNGGSSIAGAIASDGFNGSIDRAQSIGTLTASSSIHVAGSFVPGASALEGFAFVAPERLEVRATISGPGADGAELFVYDPVALQYVARAEHGTATFFARGACDVVVRGSDAGGAYTLELAARPCATTAPIEISASTAAAYLGDLAVGDSIECKLDASAATSRRVVITAPENLLLHVESTLPIAASDATVADDALVLSSSATTPDLPIQALSLVALDVSASAANANAPIIVRIEAREPASAPIASRAASAAFAPLEQELRFDARARPGAYFGLPVRELAAGQALVAPKPSAELALDVARRGARVVDAIPGGARLVAFDLPATIGAAERSRATLATAYSFASSPRVAYSEPNRVRRIFSAAPNDQYFPLQWHYQLIHLTQAWNFTTGNDNVIIAILDTGQTNHPDLVNRQIAGFDFISDPASAGDGDGIDADPTDVGDGDGPTPSSFHGTHVAGTLGAETNNQTGVAGVTWHGKLMHLRVLGKKGGTDFDIANALRYAARLPNNSNTLPAQRANVVNMSFGGAGFSNTVQSAVSDARGQGLALFAAAGNENSSQASFPAAYNGVMSVAAVDINGVRAPYSNFGSTIDIAAPGGNSAVDLDHDGHPDGVLSTLMDDSTNPLTPIYAYYEGTSMASPHVAGVAALLLAINPALTPDQIDSLLTSTAVDLGAPGRDDFYGNGLVNAYAAVIAASNIGPQRRPQIFVSVPSLAFGTNKSDLSFGVINVGIGVLDVTAATVTMDQGDNWLHATTVAASGSSNTNVSAVNVHIDRSNLADQVYTGSVHVASSNGGDADVGITMVVQHSSQPVDVNLFVLAVDATTLETKGQSVVNPTTGLGWGMFNLPQGNYILVCGSDDDENNTICDQGDTYCGLYPTLNSPQAVGLGSSPLGSLDFPVSAMSTSSADVQALLQKVRARGLRLMH